MIRRLITRQLAKEERVLGESLDYLRGILAHSLSAFFKFGMFIPLSKHRKVLPTDAYRVARIVATRDEDCGPCVQIELNLAQKEGVPAKVLQAVIDEKPESLPDSLREVYDFAQAVIGNTAEQGALREKMRQRFGQEGLNELALGMASARVFPMTKRATGYAKSCSKVTLRAGS